MWKYVKNVSVSGKGLVQNGEGEQYLLITYYQLLKRNSNPES
jgi:hypothetical protein